MNAAKRPPRVVAELGRPETPAETRIRLVENSRSYRARKTVNNLVLSLLVTVTAVAVLVLLVPRSEAPLDRPVDFASVAAQLQTGIDEPLLVPKLPNGWRSNAAQWRVGGSDKISSWYIGLLTKGNQFIGLTQGLGANPSWVAAQLKNARATDTRLIDGVRWDVYRNTAPENDRGNFDFALVTEAGTSVYLLVGTASETEFDELAGVLAGQITANNTRTTGGPE
jgi:hypothetical protein